MPGLRLSPKLSGKGGLSFPLFLFLGARNKGQGSIIFSTFDAVPVPMQFFRFICHYYILKGFSFLFFLQKWSILFPSGFHDRKKLCQLHSDRVSRTS